MRRLFIFLIILGFCSSAFANDAGYRIAMVDGKLQAKSVALILEAYSRIGISAHAEAFPAERALYNSSHGNVDAELERAVWVGRLYPDLVQVPVAISLYEVVVLTKRELPHVNSWDDLAPYRLGIERGLKVLEEGTKGLNVTWYSERERMFHLLDAGRLDAVVYFRSPAEDVLRLIGRENLLIQTPPLEMVPMYHYVHRKHADIVPALAKVLEELTAEEVKD